MICANGSEMSEINPAERHGGPRRALIRLAEATIEATTADLRRYPLEAAPGAGWKVSIMRLASRGIPSPSAMTAERRLHTAGSTPSGNGSLRKTNDTGQGRNGHHSPFRSKLALFSERPTLRRQMGTCTRRWIMSSSAILGLPAGITTWPPIDD
jgi:hypothetical protein